MGSTTLPIRWVFDVAKWTPKKVEWDLAINSIQNEEKARIEKFVFKEDSKSSLIGRLLMRKLCSEVLNISNKNVHLGRDEKERPFLLENKKIQTKLRDFNVSHQGNLCVLAAEPDSIVGIDVMEKNYKGNIPLPEFFHVMRRKFTSCEWDYICAPVPEKEQETRFFRTWSLKESFVKAEGSGLQFSLQRLSYQFNTMYLSVGNIINNTQLLIDGVMADNWYFQETLLDDNHCVAVALQKQYQTEDLPQYKWLEIEDLLLNVQPISEIDPESWEKFTNKPKKKR